MFAKIAEVTPPAAAARGAIADSLLAIAAASAHEKSVALPVRQ